MSNNSINEILKKHIRTNRCAIMFVLSNSFAFAGECIQEECNHSKKHCSSTTEQSQIEWILPCVCYHSCNSSSNSTDAYHPIEVCLGHFIWDMNSQAIVYCSNQKPSNKYEYIHMNLFRLILYRIYRQIQSLIIKKPHRD